MLAELLKCERRRRQEMADTPTFGRYAEIPYDEMTPEQQEAYQLINEARGRLPGPNKIYVHNPGLAKVMGPLGAYFRMGYSLNERQREIAVCVITSHFRSGYPTNAHEQAARAAGIATDQVEAILSGLTTSFEDPREQVVYEMAVCLSNGRWVPRGLYERAVASLGHEGITDVITLMGFYTSVAMTLAFYDVPAGAPGMER
jgi:4-carboxymuconolactone decarboxylase